MFRFRTAFRAMSVGLAPCLFAGTMLVRRTPIRFDSVQPKDNQARSRIQVHAPSTTISPEFVEQVSSGSIAGFGTGLVLALFSRSLVLLGGLVAGSIHLASRFGLDVVNLLGINRTFIGQSRLVKIWQGKPWFTSTFLLTFVLAAFVRL
ncbi:hypothetical protein VHEMI01457 [[Torrubiella] hemipterigena]|uniref:FUN14 family protein n=1 Tax=[Torrubiella] hemipterigena TaxID=1531966 RepID=A0A0A1T4U0_9HYPO|nr:hypothetical protein VHEMI01457 [[Torrubiella] hemipterigena]